MAHSKQVNIHRENPPLWFREADFGIFIHWGIYSVPAFAPVETESFDVILREKPQEYLFKNQPYAEWYKNSMAIADSPAQKHHREHYGDMPYEGFATTFRDTSKNADPEEWADYFHNAGARYVVLVTKHHDGFVMFNSRQPNPNIADYMLDFDFTGRLAQACRSRGMRFGVYYSSLLDWTFTDKPILTAGDLLLGNDNSKRYKDYCYNHWLEIIERYKPDVLWGDIGYPADKRLPDLFATYYNAVPEGMANDRWGQMPGFLRNRPGRGLVNALAKAALKRPPDKTKVMAAKYYDFRTLEYDYAWRGGEDVWFEVCRGMDKSFAYNRYSRPEDYISAEEVMKIIEAVRPDKGRLLLNVGPDENGTIPEYQKAVLTQLAGYRSGSRG